MLDRFLTYSYNLARFTARNSDSSAKVHAMKNALEVNIAGQRYVLKSDSDGTRLQAIADIVTAKVEEVRKVGKHLPTDKIAILAAVNIAEELLKEREAARYLKDAVRQRTERLVACLRSLAPLALPPSLPEGGQPPAADAQREIERALHADDGADVGDSARDESTPHLSSNDADASELGVDPADAPPTQAAPREVNASSPVTP